MFFLKKFLLLLLIFLLAIPTISLGLANAELNWPVITKECRPWTYWYWMGGFADKQGLTEHFKTYSKNGIGGVHLIHIYGVKGYEDRFIDFLSSQWLENLEYSLKESGRLGLGLDISTGSGWPFGGPNIGVEDISKSFFYRKYHLIQGQKIDNIYDIESKNVTIVDPVTRETIFENMDSKPRLVALVAYSEDADPINLIKKAREDSTLEWSAPKGRWDVYAIYERLVKQKVKRAGPGGTGYVMDPFSVKALKHYLKRFDDSFKQVKELNIRSQYHDSYEYYGANWTSDLFKQFKARRGYDLRDHLPSLLGDSSDEMITRVRYDYRRTMSELHTEFIEYWARWCRSKGTLSRNQAHGSPTNILDTYAAADIPETEMIWGTLHPLLPKCASSAAHVSGKTLVSSESCTWIDEHFKVTLEQVRHQIDQMFISGINHVFYISMAYTPKDEEWPGWLFYSSSNFGPSNSWWPHLSSLSNYITHCQSVLQSGKPANDILIYYPIHDGWSSRFDKLFIPLSVHGTKWLKFGNFEPVIKQLWNKGFSFDYISDKQLLDINIKDGKMITGDTDYRTIIIPDCRFMPLKTLNKLKDIANNGMSVIFHKDLPSDIPGHKDFEKRTDKLNKFIAELKFEKDAQLNIKRSAIGSGSFLVGDDLNIILKELDIHREPLFDAGMRSIRRAHRDGYYYFIVNSGYEPEGLITRSGHIDGEYIASDWNVKQDGWFKLGIKASSVLIMDPSKPERKGLAAIRNSDDGLTEICLQLEPNKSIILKTFTDNRIEGPRWEYFSSFGKEHNIQGKWRIDFIDGGPVLPNSLETDELRSWTKYGDGYKEFSGITRYSIEFDMPKYQADEWILDIGKVCQSARVTINGNVAGTIYNSPFRIMAGTYLREGINRVEIEIANLMANRIIDMDKRGVNWKKFYDINMVDKNYKPFDASDWQPLDSGLLGPVRLIPQRYTEPLKISAADNNIDIFINPDSEYCIYGSAQKIGTVRYPDKIKGFSSSKTVFAGKLEDVFIKELIKNNDLKIDSDWIGEEGFIVRTIKVFGEDAILVASNSSPGVSYGLTELKKQWQKEPLKKDFNIKDRPVFRFRATRERGNFTYEWVCAVNKTYFSYEGFPEMFSSASQREDILTQVYQNQANLAENLKKQHEKGGKLYILTYQPSIAPWGAKNFFSVYPEVSCMKSSRNFLCPSNEITKKITVSKFEELFRKYPSLDGVILTVQDGGANIKGPRCDMCKDYLVEKRIADYTLMIRDTIKKYNPKAEMLIRAWGLPQDIYKKLPSLLVYDDIFFMFKLSCPPCVDYSWGDRYSPFLGMERSVVNGTTSYHTDSARFMSHLCYTGPRQKARALLLLEKGVSGIWGTETPLEPDILDDFNLDAESEIAWNPKDFDPDKFIEQWCCQRFDDETVGLLVANALKDTWKITNSFIINEFQPGTFHISHFSPSRRGGYNTALAQPKDIKDVNERTFEKLVQRYDISYSIKIAENSADKLTTAFKMMPDNAELKKLLDMSKATVCLAYLFRDYHIALIYHNLSNNMISDEQSQKDKYIFLAEQYITKAVQDMDGYYDNYIRANSYLLTEKDWKKLAWPLRHHLMYLTFTREETMIGYNEIIMKNKAHKYSVLLWQIDQSKNIVNPKRNYPSRFWQDTQGNKVEVFQDLKPFYSKNKVYNIPVDRIPPGIAPDYLPEIDIFFTADLSRGAMLRFDLVPLPDARCLAVDETNTSKPKNEFSWKLMRFDIYLDGVLIDKVYAMDQRLCRYLPSRYIELPPLQGDSHHIKLVASEGTGALFRRITCHTK